MSVKAYKQAISYLTETAIPDEIENAQLEGRDDLATAYKRISVQLAHGCGRKRRKRKAHRRKMHRP